MDLRFGTTVAGYTLWHAGNMGTNSGLAADTLRGYTPDSSATANTLLLRDVSGNASVNVLTATDIQSTTVGLLDAGTAYYLDLISDSATALTSTRTLTFNVNNVNRSIALNGNIATAGDFTTSGAFALTLTATATTNFTLPAGTTTAIALSAYVNNAAAWTAAEPAHAGMIYYGPNTTAVPYSAYWQALFIGAGVDRVVILTSISQQETYQATKISGAWGSWQKGVKTFTMTDTSIYVDYWYKVGTISGGQSGRINLLFGGCAGYDAAMNIEGGLTFANFTLANNASTENLIGTLYTLTEQATIKGCKISRVGTDPYTWDLYLQLPSYMTLTSTAITSLGVSWIPFDGFATKSASAPTGTVYDKPIYNQMYLAAGEQTTNYLTKSSGGLYGKMIKTGIKDDGTTVTLDANRNLSLASGTGAFTQTHTGTITYPHDIGVSGAKTAAQSGLRVNNTSTSSTASIGKSAIEGFSTGVWAGASASNYAFYASATGGTNNYSYYAANGDVYLAANVNFTMASGAGIYSQTYTGTAEPFVISANSISGGSDVLSVSSSSTARANSSLVQITSTGTNSNTSATIFGYHASIGNTGSTVANGNIGAYLGVTGANVTNIGAKIDVSGGTTDNWGLYVTASKNYFSGQVSVGAGGGLKLLNPVARGSGNSFITYHDNGGEKAYVGFGGSTDLFHINNVAGNIGMQTAGGNVGIGTTTPDQKLDVVGVIQYGNDGASIGKLGYGTTGLITLEAGSTNTSIALLPSGTGNVGIGTSAPNTKLEVSSSGRLARFLGTGTDEYIEVNGGNDTAKYVRMGRNTTLGSFINADSDLHLFAGATNRMTIVGSTGNVGIGLTDPGTSKLYVSGRATVAATGNAAYGLVALGTGAAATADAIFIAGKNGLSNGFTVDWVDNTTKMKYVFYDGNVGIGVANPGAKLETNGSIIVNGSTYSAYGHIPKNDFDAQYGHTSQATAGASGYNTNIWGQQSGTGTNLNGGTIQLAAGAGTGTGSSTIVFKTYTPTTSGTATHPSSAIRATISSAGLTLPIGTVTSPTFTSTAPIGTAPLIVTSDTVVANLAAAYVGTTINDSTNAEVAIPVALDVAGRATSTALKINSAKLAANLSTGMLKATTLNLNSTAATTSTDGYLYKTTVASYVPAPTGETTALAFMGRFYATKVFNAVYNDIADFIQVEEDTPVEYGKAYVLNGKHYLAAKYAEKGLVGIASDTYGFGVGQKASGKQIAIAIGGFVLAHLDKKYDSGTPLTATKGGILTKANLFVRLFYPERILATFYKEEKEKMWHDIEVSSRHWVKVK